MKRNVFVLAYCVISVTFHLTSSLPVENNEQSDININVDEQFQQQQQQQQQQQKQQPEYEEFLHSRLENIQERNVRPAGCPADFVYLRHVNGCYKVVTDLLQWGLAGIRCGKLNSNAHLLIVNSASEQRVVVKDLAKWHGGCTIGMWTAGQRLNPAIADGFVWKVLNPVDYPSARIEEMTYTHWASGQPDNGGASQSCVHLWREKQFAWDDFHCHYRLCSICEIDI